MKPAHMLLALGITAIWGVNFVVIQVGLHSMPPLLMAGLRFVIVALPVLFLPRPAVAWGRLVAIGLTLFTLQFAFLFTGMKVGMPAGLASIILQAQVLFTVLLGVVVLGERPSVRLVAGCVVVFAGLAMIALTLGTGGFNAAGLVLTLCAAAGWAAGNVLLRGAPKADMVAMVAWLSLVPPVPLLLCSLVLEGPRADYAALAGIGWVGVGALLYIAVLSTTVGYGVWGFLLGRYPASQVAPFSALVPVFGTVSAAVLLGEQFPGARLVGMGLIVGGLLILVLPGRRVEAAKG